eukprot:1143294-Pelagomonas_calceolata.AAC.2
MVGCTQWHLRRIQRRVYLEDEGKKRQQIMLFMPEDETPAFGTSGLRCPVVPANRGKKRELSKQRKVKKTLPTTTKEQEMHWLTDSVDPFTPKVKDEKASGGVVSSTS